MRAHHGMRLLFTMQSSFLLFYCCQAFRMPTKVSVFEAEQVVRLPLHARFISKLPRTKLAREGVLVPRKKAKPRPATLHMSKGPNSTPQLTPRLLLTTVGLLGALLIGSSLFSPAISTAPPVAGEAAAPAPNPSRLDAGAGFTLTGTAGQGGLRQKLLAARVKATSAEALIGELKEQRKDLEVPRPPARLKSAIAHAPPMCDAHIIACGAVQHFVRDKGE